jgi:hypothetical protein
MFFVYFLVIPIEPKIPISSLSVKFEVRVLADSHSLPATRRIRTLVEQRRRTGAAMLLNSKPVAFAF